MNKATLEDGLFRDLKNPARYNNLYYFVKDIDGYQCHIFLFVFDNVLNLRDEWEEINSAVAAEFQTSLESEIELWNVYLVFSVNTVVPRDIKYVIEQDRYSSRKLVLDENPSDNIEEIMNVIDKKIFTIDCELPRNQIQEDSKSVISKVDNDILKALEGYNSGIRIEQFYTSYKKLKDLRDEN